VRQTGGRARRHPPPAPGSATSGLAREAAPSRVEIGWINATAPTPVGAVAMPAAARGINDRGRGYDGRMSESSNEQTGSAEEHETPEVGLVPDEELPEDLQPKENPLARDPGDDSGDDASGEGGSDDTKVEGMPDMGQPGAAG